MLGDIDRILIPRQRIAQRVSELASQITADFGGEEITIIPILTGAMIFCADLIRHMPLAMRIGLLTVSSYPGQSIRAQGAAMLWRQLGDLAGRNVLLVEDILDSGGTLRLVLGELRAMQPGTLKTCLLLRKDRPESRDLAVDYVGFDVPDEFVVGYGLDYGNLYRNLPDIVTLKPHVYARSQP